MILKRENEKWEHNVTYPHPISNFITNFPFSHSSLPVPVLSDPNFFFFFTYHILASQIRLLQRTFIRFT